MTREYFASPAGAPARGEVIGVPFFDDLSTPDAALPGGALGEAEAGFLARCGFCGKVGQSQALPGAGDTSVVALGVGRREEVDAGVLRRAGAALGRASSAVTSVATTLAAAATSEDQIPAIVEGIGLGAYRFEGQRRDAKPSALARVEVLGATPEAVERGRATLDATVRARDWVNQPPRQMTPTRLGEIATELAAEDPNMEVRVWGPLEIAAERLGALGGVASGASEPARLIRLAYRAPGSGVTLALVGKGITFDSGGLSLKPPASMMTMKSDMGGAAAVLSAVAAAARLRAGVNVVGWVATTENMPGGRALHPGDVVVARNGTSIEVLNTDAEGRLVLADALSLAVEEEPQAIIDIATLTGGQRVALGADVAAVMGNDDSVVGRVQQAGARAGEPAWRMPLVASYRRHLDSEVADIKNVAPASAGASSVVAALFLQEFVSGRPWAHLDIAAPSWSESEDGWLSKGATGWGARTLVETVLAWE